MRGFLFVHLFINMKIIITETQVKNFLKRRFTYDELEEIVNEVQEMIDGGESYDTALYDGIREFIKKKNFPDIDEFGPDDSYWDSYLKYERILVDYVKSKLSSDVTSLRSM